MTADHGSDTHHLPSKMQKFPRMVFHLRLRRSAKSRETGDHPGDFLCHFPPSVPSQDEKHLLLHLPMNSKTYTF